VVEGESTAVNPQLTGTKFAAWSILEVPAGSSTQLDLILSATTSSHPFRKFDQILSNRQQEANHFYQDLLPEANVEDHVIQRQSLAGLIWSKQYYHFDVGRWLDGDLIPPPAERKQGRNHAWRHLKAADILLMPDSWEYPWFAAWDLAFHSVAMATVDIDFAKEQLELLLSERFLHPSGQIPAYEWAFDDVNPPVHAWAVLECFDSERTQRGHGDLAFLRRCFNKLVLNYGWWLNRKDPDSRGVFEGGFMGLDNISVYDRSRPLPTGFSLKQADATGWMAMVALNLTHMALELALEEHEYEEMAIQFHSQFFAIAKAIYGFNDAGVSLWDPVDSFFKDAVESSTGVYSLPVFSWVGLIPLFGSEIARPELLQRLPRYREFLAKHAGGRYDGHFLCACPYTENDRGEHFFSLVRPADLPAIMARVLSAEEFNAPHGVRSLSKRHGATQTFGDIPGLGQVGIDYEPGESCSVLFGGNSNWRGPVWLPLNYLLVCALDRIHHYLTESFTVPSQVEEQQEMTLATTADRITKNLIGIFRRDTSGLRPLFPADSPFQDDPHWRELLQFYEYFHGETGQGLGAAHQTGWTALIANLLQRQYANGGGNHDS
jgi:hypothetical protein